jgi:outer membrane protein OmpA-like peptidoglycan-associated protein
MNMFAPPVAIAKAIQPQRSSSISKPPSTYETAHTKQTDTAKAPAWDFSKTLVFPAQRLPGPLQAKLPVGAFDDPLEHEADRVADQVMRMPAPGVSLTSARPRVSRLCEACAAEEEEKLQRKEAGASHGGASDAPDSVHAVLRSPGQSLDAGARGFFESRFGQSFGDVRVHADRAGDEAAQSVGALAFTVGRDVAFRTGAYAPDTQGGRQLLAHELTHVLQQRGAGRRTQRTPACPPRPTSEAAQSRTPAGILAKKVEWIPSSLSTLDIMDFAVGDAKLPPGTTTDSAWQQGMSIMAGDPSIEITVDGFTDCTGSDGENVSLRQARANTVLSVLQKEVRSKVVRSKPAMSLSTFLDTNGTPEGRARNRSVRIAFFTNPISTSCDLLTKASTIDEFIFLVTCLEDRLFLTAPTDAPKALSVLRQIYYGTDTWSAHRNFAWGNVITPNWIPGADPTPLARPHLMAALKASQVVENTDIGHVLTGIDAMMNPHNVEHLPGVINATTVPNEEWATWAGDVGQAAVEWVMSKVFPSPKSPKTEKDAFTQNAGDEDLRGNIDAFAMRQGFNPGAAPAGNLMQTIKLTGTLSEDLRQYFRITSSALGQSRAHATRDFIAAYGGVLSGKTVSNRAAFAARLRPSVMQFALLYQLKRIFIDHGGFSKAAPGAPMPIDAIGPAVDAMIDFFITWLEQN